MVQNQDVKISDFSNTFYILLPDVLVGFEPITYTYSEGVGSASIRIIKVGDADFNTTVSFSTVDGSAVGENHENLC